MEYKIIVLGNLKNHPRFQVELGQGECERYFHKVMETMVECVHIYRLEQWKEEVHTKKRIILCMDLSNQVKDQELNELQDKNIEVLYVVNLDQFRVEQLFQMIVSHFLDHKLSYRSVSMAGTGDSIGMILLEVLSHFQLIANRKVLHFLVGAPQEPDIDEVAQITDVLNEYLEEQCGLEIKTIQSDTYCYIVTGMDPR